MKRLLLLILLIHNSLFFAQSDKDTLVFDLSSATTYNSAGDVYFEFPIYVITTGGISNFDFSFKFNESKLTYDATTAVDINLETSSFFNSSDRYLRNTTSGPNLNYNIESKNALVKVRFILANSDVIIKPTDFFECSALMNGSPGNFYWTPKSSWNPGVGLSIISNPIPCEYSIQNPVKNDITITDPMIKDALISATNGQIVSQIKAQGGTICLPFEQLNPGYYLITVNTHQKSCFKKIIISN
jgi:hypothetical protein